MTDASAPLVEAVAGQLRRLFFQAYRTHHIRLKGTVTDFGSRHVAVWDGGHAGERTYAPLWPKLALACIDHQLDPATFIEAQFRGLDKLPNRSRFEGDAAVRRCLAAVPQLEHELAYAITASRQNLAVQAICRRDMRGLSDRDAVASVLLDPTLDLSGLFRYVIAAQYGYPDVAARFRQAALLQYVFHREAYDRIWRNIPEELRLEAAAAVGRGGRTHG